MLDEDELSNLTSMSTLSSSAKILGLARTIVSTTNHSGGHLAKTFRELAASLAASSRSKLLFQKNPRSVSTASQLVNEDDAHLGSLLESIQIPVQHLWQKRNQTALDVDIKRFRNSSNSIYGKLDCCV